jgi:hypothetical protein
VSAVPRSSDATSRAAGGYYDADWHEKQELVRRPDLPVRLGLRRPVQERRCYQADRGPGEVLYAGGLRDARLGLEADTEVGGPTARWLAGWLVR